MSVFLGARHGGFYIIAAAALIGLGVGIIAGYLLTGFLVGLGLGYLVYVAGSKESPGQGVSPARGNRGSYLIRVIIGLYVVASGFAIILVPRPEWPVILAVFLILAGTWLLVHGYSRGRS